MPQMRMDATSPETLDFHEPVLRSSTVEVSDAQQAGRHRDTSIRYPELPQPGSLQEKPVEEEDSDRWF